MAAPPNNPNRIQVSAKDLQARFNKDFQPRLDKKTYQLNVYSEKPAPKDAGQVPGAMSTMYELIDQQGSVVGMAHAYVNPDGTYGASGMLDPKRLRVGNKTYYTSESSSKKK